MGSTCYESTKYTCLMCINHFCMPYSTFEDDGISGLESRQFGGVLRVMFLRESDKIKKQTSGRAPSQLNCDRCSFENEQ